MDKEAKILKRLMPRVFSKKLPQKIGVVKISESRSKKLNRIYRDKNKPANVLSFRYGSDYGEILVCPEVIRREAKKQKNTYKYQMTWMIIHGMLHLAGMHHEKSKSASEKVEVTEKSILKKFFGSNF